MPFMSAEFSIGTLYPVWQWLFHSISYVAFFIQLVSRILISAYSLNGLFGMLASEESSLLSYDWLLFLSCARMFAT